MPVDYSSEESNKHVEAHTDANAEAKFSKKTANKGALLKGALLLVPQSNLHSFAPKLDEIAVLKAALDQSQQLLEEARVDYEDFYELAPIAYCSIDAQGMILQANVAFASMLETARNALLHLPISSFIQPDDLNLFDWHQQTLQGSHRAQAFVLNMRKANGALLWAQVDMVSTSSKAQSASYRLSFNDITASRKLQTQLTLLETCISRLNDIVMITEAEPIDAPGPRIVFVNDAFVQHTGFSREEAIGQSPRILQGPKTQRAALDTIKQAMQRWQPVRTELINYTKSGDDYWLELDIVPVADHTGWFTHWIAIERDITERKLAELEFERLNRALKMRSAMSDLISHVTSETALLQQACQLAVEMGGYDLAWVGYALQDDFKTILPVAVAGMQMLARQDSALSWAENHAHGQGPAARSIRAGATVICEHCTHADFIHPVVDVAQPHGLTGVICLPLREQLSTLGVWAIYLKEVCQLTTEETVLWEAIANELAFGISSIRTREADKRSQAALLKVAASVSLHAEISFFDQLIRNMAEALNADGAFIATYQHAHQTKPFTHAATIRSIWLNEVHDNVEFSVRNSPCQYLLEEDQCFSQHNLAEQFPDFPLPQASLINGYVGHSLYDSKNEIIGFIFLLFKQRLENSDFLTSTLTIFAARAAAELERLASDERNRQQASLLDKAQDAILVIGFDRQILFWNKSAERLYGWTAAEAMQTSVDTLIYLNTSEFYKATEHVIAHDEWTGEMHQLKKDGDMITVEGRWTLVRDAAGTPQSILSINTDISARKSAQEEIQQLAFYDPLTKLPNRQLLTDRLKQIIAAKTRHHKISAVLFIDLDNFKALNDTLGHSIGDLLLKEVAHRLSNSVRKCDTVSRLGGDEFVVIITELSEQHARALMLAQNVAAKVLDVLNEPYHLAGHAHHSSPSIGVTLIGQQADDVDVLLKQADLAMYQAKTAGRNTIRFYNEAMQTAINNRVTLEADIRVGLANHEFLLHYQPQINHHGVVTGAEVLIRWHSAKRGMVSPLQFIAVAENTRLIVPIGNWVLETACETLVAWAQQPYTQSLFLSVNVSVCQFRQKDFVQEVMHILKKTGANPYKLKLELTESLLIDNVDDIIQKMKALKAIGIGFSLDDFGTGYSSLSYLKLLPLDQLKIDQSFVRDALTDNNNATIARAIINLGQNLGLQVIAEGVETEEQRAFLLLNQCYHYQGYLFGKPLPLALFQKQLLAQSHPIPSPIV